MKSGLSTPFQRDLYFKLGGSKNITLFLLNVAHLTEMLVSKMALATNQAIYLSLQWLRVYLH